MNKMENGGEFFIQENVSSHVIIGARANFSIEARSGLYIMLLTSSFL